MADLPRIVAGSTFESAGTATQWQNVVNAARMILDMKVLFPLRVTKTNQTMTLAVKAPTAAEIAEAMGAVSAFVVVRDIGATDDVYVDVQRVIPNLANGPWDGTYVVDGDVESIIVYPGQEPQDFAAFVWPVGVAINRQTPILTAIKVGEAWYLPQYLRYRLAPPDVNIPFGDCTPHIEGP